jgi:hypothetical protein
MRPLGAICTAIGFSDPECVRKDRILTGKSYDNGSLRGPLQVGRTAPSRHDTDTAHATSVACSGMPGIYTCLIVAPREHNIIETAMWLVDAVFCRIYLIVRIRVGSKSLGVNDLV